MKNHKKITRNHEKSICNCENHDNMVMGGNGWQETQRRKWSFFVTHRQTLIYHHQPHHQDVVRQLQGGERSQFLELGSPMQELVSMIAITTIIGIKRSCSQSSRQSRLVEPIVFIIILVQESWTDSIIIRLPIGLPRGNCYWAILGPALVISNQATSHQFKKKSP